MTATLIAATDGSALGNPGPAGWCYFVDDSSWAAGGFAHGTNNMVELHAVYELLKAVPETVPLEIRADSQYVVKAFQGMRNAKTGRTEQPWVNGWRRRGWVNATGAPVANQNLIRAIDLQLRERAGSTVFVWVRAHQTHGGDVYNENADRRALAASEAVKAGHPVSSGPGFRG